jgi:two-component system response regulator YesN
MFDMHSLMIVDDEPIVLRAISHVIENSCPDIQVVAKTGSGTEAVSLALREKPDIIFMDIELTGVNGLEAITEIKKILPETVFIIISAYDSFQYAQKSIALGVVDYLLKPVSKDDLVAILGKAAARLDEQRGKTREHMELRDKLQRMRPFLEEDLFFSLLYPSIGMHPLLEYPQLLDLHFTLGQAVGVYAADCKQLTENFNDYKQLIKNQLCFTQNVLFSPLIGRTALILIGYDSPPKNQIGIWKLINDLLKSHLRLETGIILGRLGEGFEGMIQSFNELRQSTQLHSYPTGVYCLGEVPKATHKEFSIPWVIEQEFFEAAKSGQKELAGVIFTDLFRLVTAALADLQSQQDYFHGIIAVLLRVFYENTPAESKQLFNGNNFIQKINHVNDLNELELALENIINQLITEIKNNGTAEKNPEIRAAIQYMTENYYKELTLADVAAAAAISPNYLSKLFKEYRNQTVMDFLERIRIEKALKLLKESNCSIKEISVQIGYRDPNYFSKVFKKVTNIPPTAVRG